MPRRTALCFGLTALVASGPSRAVSVDQAMMLPQPGDLLVTEAGGTIINPTDLSFDAPPTRARAMDPATRIIRNRVRSSQILLISLDAKDLQAAQAPFAAAGIVAFSAICTHAGCLVSEWKPIQRNLLCPCHGSVYDPADGGRVVAGPAPRPLPALPLRLTQDGLTVAAAFTARIGASTGRTD